MFTKLQNFLKRIIEIYIILLNFTEIYFDVKEITKILIFFLTFVLDAYFCGFYYLSSIVRIVRLIVRYKVKINFRNFKLFD